MEIIHKTATDAFTITIKASDKENGIYNPFCAIEDLTTDGGAYGVRYPVGASPATEAPEQEIDVLGVYWNTVPEVSEWMANFGVSER